MEKKLKKTNVNPEMICDNIKEMNQILQPLNPGTKLKKIMNLKEKYNLYRYQAKDVNRVLKMENLYKGGILGDQMELGKTIHTFSLCVNGVEYNHHLLKI
jgi:SNF2 family DNA or RNA helicase